MKYFFLLSFLLSTSLYAQNVSTFFSSPTIDVNDGLVLDAQGNLYGSNFSEGTVFKITPSGDATLFIEGLINPNGLALDSEENLFVADFSNERIYKYDPDGIPVDTFFVGANPSGLIKSPDNDDIIFTRTSNSSINRLSSDGAITTIYQGSPLNAPVGLAYDDEGQLYTGNFTGRKIYKVFTDTVEYIAAVPSGGAGGAYLGFIAFGGGHLWGTTYGGHKIYKINPGAVDDVTLFAGSSAGDVNGPVSIATFDFPNGIVYKPSENALYVSEFGGQGDIRKISNLSVVGIHSPEALDVQFVISPNPSNNDIWINCKLPRTRIRFTLTDISGKVVFESSPLGVNGDLDYKIDVSKFHPGLYWLHLLSEEGFQSSKAISILR